MEPETRNGLSLACNDHRLRSAHSRVNGPDLLLRFPASRFPGPFGPSAPQPRPVRPKPGCLIASNPLPVPPPARLTALPASTPLRDSYLPPDQSVRRNLPPAGSPSGPPDLRSLPAAAAISNSGCGSSFPVRYVPEACCSSNLLEPPPICRGSGFWSNVILHTGTLFLSYYFLCL